MSALRIHYTHHKINNYRLKSYRVSNVSDQIVSFTLGDLNTINK